ncbi:hypothetical protein ACWCOP_03135 [Maricaulaceae bacterium MS644]
MKVEIQEFREATGLKLFYSRRSFRSGKRRQKMLDFELHNKTDSTVRAQIWIKNSHKNVVIGYLHETFADIGPGEISAVTIRADYGKFYLHRAHIDRFDGEGIQDVTFEYQLNNSLTFSAHISRFFSGCFGAFKLILGLGIFGAVILFIIWPAIS